MAWHRQGAPSRRNPLCRVVGWDTRYGLVRAPARRAREAELILINAVLSVVNCGPSRRRMLADLWTRATNFGSNWRPACLFSSSSALCNVRAVRYGLSVVIASNVSATIIIRAPIDIA